MGNILNKTVLYSSLSLKIVMNIGGMSVSLSLNILANNRTSTIS